MKLQDVIKQIKDGGRKYDTCGAVCDYFKVNDKIGIKVYENATRRSFMRSLNRHLLVLKRFRAAPKIYGSITINGKPALIVEHCRTVRSINDDYERALRVEAISVLLNVIKKEIPECYLDAEDCHPGNIGINQAGYPVLIDFS